MEVSPYEHWLGGLAERHPRFFLGLGNLETRWLQHLISQIKVARPIFIAGLARSGSTILLEILASHPDVGTHRYRDFPLLQIPVWWNWFLDRASRGSPAAVERSHKDGIYVTPDSPEAMEEILWMAFFPDVHNPQVGNLLDDSNPNASFDRFFGDHVRKLLMVQRRKRYLSKGNYNVSRLRYLQRLYPDARFVIPLRDPVSHVASLMKQHQLFCAEERRDPRVLAYMRRAGHFEFGVDRRPINFGDPAYVRRVEDAWAQNQEVLGWAVYWASVYGYIAQCLEGDPRLAERSILVPYDELCRRPEASLAHIHRHCALEIIPEALARQASRIQAPGYYRPSFSADEIATIRAETDETVERLKHLCDARTVP